MNKNNIFLRVLPILVIAVFLASFAAAQTDEFAEAKKLIDAKTPCSKLTESQLELIGDYYMEKIHPGEAHTLMEKMMGGEGSERLKLMHINMGKRFYCNDGSANYGMMGGGMMIGSGSGIGMMQVSKTQGYGGRMGYENRGMMSGYGWGFFGLLYTILLIGIIMVVYLWVIKLWKTMGKK